MIDAPSELTTRPQWVAWRYEDRDGESKRTKVPVNPQTGAHASTTDPSTWSSFDEASAYADDGHADGVGYVLSADDPYVGIDLDHCRDPESGALETWAKAIVRRLSSYTEISPSGTGLRIFVIGELPPHGRRKGHIEVYCKARFLTMTGDRYMAAPSVIKERDAELLDWHHEVFGDGPPPQTNGHTSVVPGSLAVLADAEVVSRAQAAENGLKFWALWNGDYSMYPSQSEADLALANLLAFWCGPDPMRIEQLFSASGMMRDKWEQRADYRDWTIHKALEGRTDYYDPHYRSSSFGIGADVHATAVSEVHLEHAWDLMTSTPEVSLQLAEHFLWQGRTHWLYSNPGAGKTLLELAVLLHVAAGVPFHGHAVIQGGVVILEEDSPRVVISDYLHMLGDLYDIDIRTAPLWFFKKRGVHLKDREGYEYAKSVIGSAPDKPAVFLVDACERVVPSEKFNSRELEYVGRLFAENLAEGITNVMIDHTRKSQLTNGEKVDPIEVLYGGRSKSAISDVMMYVTGTIKNRAMLSFPKFRGVEPSPVHVSFDGAAGFSVKTQKVQLSDSERAVMLVLNGARGEWLGRAAIGEAAHLSDKVTIRALSRLMSDEVSWVERQGDSTATTYRVSHMGGGGLFS